MVIQLFPINLPNLWYSSDQKEQSINHSDAESWICSDSSLTVKIKELGIAFSVDLLNQVNRPVSSEIQSVLFQSPQAIRSNIEFAVVEPNSQLGQFIEQQLQQPIKRTCYIRRSIFHLNGKPLLVCECFIPALFN